jgi:hypothetical protein
MRLSYRKKKRIYSIYNLSCGLSNCNGSDVTFPHNQAEGSVEEENIPDINL